MKQSFAQMSLGHLFAILLVYFLMVVNFQSWLGPFIILTALPGRARRSLWAALRDAHDAQRTVAHGRDHGDRRRDFEQHPDGHVRQRAARPASAKDSRDGRADRRPHAAAPRPDDGARHALRHAADGLGLGEGGEQNAPLGRAVIGGLLRGDVLHAVLRPGRLQRAAAKAAAGRDSNGRGENGKGAAEEVPAGEKAAGATGEAVMSNSSGIEQEPAAAEPSHVDHSVPRARTRTMQVIGLGILVLFAVLLVVSVIPRVINRHRLAKAAQSVRTAVTSVHVVSPVAASEAGLSIAATTQAMQDAIIYARTSGCVRKRYVDIGDDVKAGELLAEIDSPEIDQQLMQARADLRTGGEEPGPSESHSGSESSHHGSLQRRRRGGGGCSRGGGSERVGLPDGGGRRRRGGGERRIESGKRPEARGLDRLSASRRTVRRDGDPNATWMSGRWSPRAARPTTPPWLRPA